MNNDDGLSNNKVEIKTYTNTKKHKSKNQNNETDTVFYSPSSLETFLPSVLPNNGIPRTYSKKGSSSSGCEKSDSKPYLFDNDLNKAFNECLDQINSDGNLTEEELDNTNSIIDGNFNTFNNKRNQIYSNEYDCYSKDNECSKTKKIKGDPIIDDVSAHNLKSSKKVPTDSVSYLTNKYSQTNSQFILQNDLCLFLPSNIDKCIECHYYQKKLREQDYDNIVCRFSAFRKLRITNIGKSVAGYLSRSDAIENDMEIWLHTKNSNKYSDVEIEISMKILEDIGGLFCEFYALEKKALKKIIDLDKRKKTKVLWKRNIYGVREMCDVCKTSLFNHHWFCGKCGFVVCIDCFGVDDFSGTSNKQYRKKEWIHCSNEEKHKANKLSITQIIAGNSMSIIWKEMHNVCKMFDIPMDCECSIEPPKVHLYTVNSSHSTTDVTCLDTVNITKGKNQLIKKQNQTEPERNNQENNFCPTICLPNLSETCENQWDAPHMWLCNGNLLRLLDPKCEDNYTIFQAHWKCGRPVIISGVGRNLKPSLWRPESFSRDFGNQLNDLINCVTSKVISNHPMSIFWNGFEDSGKRLCDSKGDPMLLKLKDWPPSTDFAELLPERFQNLMDCLPLKKYTHRNGCLNLASYLPECFVKPDLGPKMYTAYGCVGDKYEHIGTTNLHLDMTDAVNVMIHVAITINYKDFDCNWQTKRAIDLLKEAGCDDTTMKRINEDGEIPGALWHIYHPTHADPIRILLTKVATEQNVPYEEFSDPIHDQDYYLDGKLRDRLYHEYGIRGCTIVQFDGDAVFIPAGAPHQVRNLHNCIKVAEDFVSPENIHYSYKMTQEFRHLSDGHTNHEDKLQIKNIVYHSVKDTISTITSYINNMPQ